MQHIIFYPWSFYTHTTTFRNTFLISRWFIEWKFENVFQNRRKSNFFYLYLSPFMHHPQDINFIYQTRISRANKTINRNKRECNSRICRFMSESNVFIQNASNVLTHRHSDFNNDNQETIPLLIEPHDHLEHHSICKCSCLPRLFNCCFFVS